MAVDREVVAARLAILDDNLRLLADLAHLDLATYLGPAYGPPRAVATVLAMRPDSPVKRRWSRSLPEYPLHAELDAGDQEDAQIDRIDSVPLSGPGAKSREQVAARLADTMRRGRVGRAGVAGTGQVTTAAGFWGKTGCGGAGTLRWRQPVMGKEW